MKISGKTIYWTVICDKIRIMLECAIPFLCIALFISFCLWLGPVLHTKKPCGEFCFLNLNTTIPSFLVLTAAVGLAVCWVGLAFIPSTKDLAAIFVIPLIAENEKLSEIPSELADLAIQWIKEIKPKKE